MFKSFHSIPKSVQLVFKEPQGQAENEDIFVGVTPEKHSFSKRKKLKNDRIIVGVTPERIKLETEVQSGQRAIDTVVDSNYGV